MYGVPMCEYTEVEARGGSLLCLSLQHSSQVGSLTVCGDHCYFSEVSGQADPMILLCLKTQPSSNRSR